MQILPPHKQGAPIAWMTAGILIGITLASIGVAASAVILTCLAILAWCRGYRVRLTKDDDANDRS